MSEQDVDKLELLAGGFNGLVDVGEDVFADGVVDWKDSQHLGKLGEEVKKIITAAKAYREMIGEVKDIDPAEAVKIVQTLFAVK